MGTPQMGTAGLDRILAAGVVAVVRAPHPDGAVATSRALLDGGITAIEIAFTTPSAELAIAEVSTTFGDQVCVGAGTVLTPAQAEAAADAGAEFLVSPGCEHNVMAAAMQTGRTVLPGVLTPSEVMQALRYDVPAVKLFPGSLGGPAYLRALRGPFPTVMFMPTGGVSLGNVADWFAAGAFALGVAGELCPPDLVNAGRFEEITDRARHLVDTVAAVQQ